MLCGIEELRKIPLQLGAIVRLSAQPYQLSSRATLRQLRQPEVRHFSAAQQVLWPEFCDAVDPEQAEAECKRDEIKPCPADPHDANR